MYTNVLHITELLCLLLISLGKNSQGSPPTSILYHYVVNNLTLTKKNICIALDTITSQPTEWDTLCCFAAKLTNVKFQGKQKK